MTKKELEKEAEKYINNKQKPITKYDLVAFAESREKEIKILGERCLQLQRNKGNLIDRVRELEQQNEKMKSDVREEIGFAKNFNELHTYSVLNNLLNRWETKEDDL